MPGLRGFFVPSNRRRVAAAGQGRSPVSPAGPEHPGEALPYLISGPPLAGSHSVGILRSANRGCSTFCMAPNTGRMEEHRSVAKVPLMKHRFEGSQPGWSQCVLVSFRGRTRNGGPGVDSHSKSVAASGATIATNRLTRNLGAGAGGPLEYCQARHPNHRLSSAPRTDPMNYSPAYRVMLALVCGETLIPISLSFCALLPVIGGQPPLVNRSHAKVHGVTFEAEKPYFCTP